MRAHVQKAMQEGAARRHRDERQSRMRAILARKTEPCTCGITARTTDEALRAMPGCCDPQYVCGTLAEARRVFL